MIPGALGIASHREGKDTLALGDYSHSEGEETQAQGKSSHAEGYKTASIGEGSHAEGSNTIATGAWSHVEGIGTIAKNFSQHVCGLYNKAESNKTVHEIGIGSSDTNRKNGFEVFYDGSVKTPSQEFSKQKSGDGSDVVTVDYVHDIKLANEIKGSGEIELDFERNINFTLEVSQNSFFKRPLNAKSGQEGTFQIFNPTNSIIDLKVGDYIFETIAGFNATMQIFPFKNLIVKYIVMNEENIFLGNFYTEYTPHLPLQVNSNGDFLMINDTDYLVQ